jgi:hypothetical protein
MSIFCPIFLGSWFPDSEILRNWEKLGIWNLEFREARSGNLSGKTNEVTQRFCRQQRVS